MLERSLPTLAGAAMMLACAHADAVDKKPKEDTMSASLALADFLGTLEKALPLDPGKLASLVRATFKPQKDRNHKTVLVASKFQATEHGVALGSVRFYPPDRSESGELLIELAGSVVDEAALMKSYPVGSWRPPPPPGWAPEGTGPVYIVDRPWGEIWFGFHDGVVRNVSFAFGQHSGSGV